MSDNDEYQRVMQAKYDGGLIDKSELLKAKSLSIEQELLQMLKEEREKSHQLTQLLLKQNNLLNQEEETVTVLDQHKGIGKLPWNIQKSLLEKKSHKIPIPEVDSTIESKEHYIAGGSKL